MALYFNIIFKGNKHADEIAQLSISLLKALRSLRDNSSKFPRIQGRIGVHSGNTRHNFWHSLTFLKYSTGFVYELPPDPLIDTLY